MAIVEGTTVAVSQFTQANGASLLHTVSGVENEVESCMCSVQWTTGTYDQADDATFEPAQAIQESKRTGKTITILQAALLASGDEEGAVVSAGACTVAANVITCELLQEDFTERAATAMGATWDRPIAFQVTYRQSANA